MGVPRGLPGGTGRVREFLTSRRARISPQQAGLPDVGQRRVPGLRRGEVATLAGVSVEYYSRYAAEPGSASEHALRLLASLAATASVPTRAGS